MPRELSAPTRGTGGSPVRPPSPRGAPRATLQWAPSSPSETHVATTPALVCPPNLESHRSHRSPSASVWNVDVAGPVAPTAGAPAAGGSPAEGCWRWRGAGLGREPRDDRRRPGDPRSPPAAQKQVRTRRGHGCHVWRRPPSAVCLRWATCPPVTLSATVTDVR